MSWRQQATPEQITMLLDFLCSNKDLARGLLRGPDARLRTKRLWDEIAEQLNSVGGAHKTSVQWQKNDENQNPLGEQMEEEVLWDDHNYCSSPPHAISHSDQQMVSRSPLAPFTASFTHSARRQEQTNTCSPIAPTAAITGSATHSARRLEQTNTCSPIAPTAAITGSATQSAWQQEQPTTCPPIAAISASPTHSARRRQEQPNTCSPIAPTVAVTGSATRRVREMGRRTMRAQPNVAGRILEGEREKAATMVEIKNALQGIQGQMEALNNNMVELMAFLKEKRN